jgi:ferredoxin
MGLSSFGGDMNTYQDPQINDDLVEVYTGLSEVLMPSIQAGLPEWVAFSGTQWPFYEACIRLADGLNNPNLDQCALALSEVPVSSLDRRSNEYEALFIGNENPPIWLNESYYVNGRIVGPILFSTLDMYQEAGLKIEGAELADHAGLELAFPAYLVDREKNDPEFFREWKQARQLFIKNHPGRWLPEVGRLMSRSIYPGWSAIGLLIIALFGSAVNQTNDKNVLPNIAEPDMCTLCGFCVQVCPTGALRIHEDEKSSSLYLETSLCNSCTNCGKICPEKVLSLSASPPDQSQVLLRESPLASCSNCGEKTFSQAELDYTQNILGNPDWLAFCLDCRSRSIG